MFAGKVSKEEVMVIASKDRRAYTSDFKREPLKHSIRYWMIGGVPHKLVNGQWVALKSINA